MRRAFSVTTKAAARTPQLSLYAPLRPSAATATRRQKDGGVVSATESSNISMISNFVNCIQRTNENNNNGLLFSGIEASLVELGADTTEQRESAELIQKSGLELLVSIDIDSDFDRNNDGIFFSSGDLKASAKASNHLGSLECQLLAVSDLGSVVAHVNCRGFGRTRRVDAPDEALAQTSFWDQQSTLRYLLDALPLSAQFLEDHPHIGRQGNETDVMGGSPDHLIGISHETTSRYPIAQGSRGSDMLNHPDIVRYILEVVPPLRLTMDLSSWHNVCGYVWGSKNEGEEEEALSVEIVPHIDLIRVRTSVLSGYNRNEESTENDRYISMHKSLWEEVWTRKASRGVEKIFMTLDDDGCTLSANEDVSYRGTTSTSDDNEDFPRAKRLEHFALYIHQSFENWSKNRT